MDLVRARTWINLYYGIQMRKIWLVAAVVAAAGCGKKEEPAPRQAPEAAAAPAKPQAKDARPAIVVFGDSISAGFGLDTGQSFPDLLQKDLDARGAAYRVVNMGVSGDTTQDGLARLSMALAERPKIVLLELGANDGLRGIPSSVMQANLAQMIEAFQGAGAQVVLAGMTLPPNYGPEFIRKFDAVYTGLASKYNVTADSVPHGRRGRARGFDAARRPAPQRGGGTQGGGAGDEDAGAAGGNAVGFVRGARDARVPLFAHRIKVLPRSEGRRGVGRGRGVRPTVEIAPSRSRFCVRRPVPSPRPPSHR